MVYRIIGIMTGNSMDAIDLVLTEFNGINIKDICAFTKPYTKDMQDKIEKLRTHILNQAHLKIEEQPDFISIHDAYIQQVAACVIEMCERNNIDKSRIDAIGFHGKTLDHNPPSKAKKDGSWPYTLQMGSGQMLADLTQIPVVYDFRSDLLMAGFEGAPLVAPHNAHMSLLEGEGCFYNGGNTSNFSLIKNGHVLFASDAGPFNEYTDSYIRQETTQMFDQDGFIGQKGVLNQELLQTLFNIGREYYETALPKSGDPSLYMKRKVFQHVREQRIKLEDAVYTFEYFAAYIAVQALTLIPENINLPHPIILFGGGWKNPIVRLSFEHLLQGRSFILKEHKKQFLRLSQRFSVIPKIQESIFGTYMEARLFADLARYKLENKAWEIPETYQARRPIVCGCIARPNPEHSHAQYIDRICRAAKGWQHK